MHALQQTNRRKKENEVDIDDVTDMRSPSSPGMDHMIIIVDHMIM